MYCPYCGQEALPDTVYCAKCGKPLAAETVERKSPLDPAESSTPVQPLQPSPLRRHRLRLVLFIIVPVIVLAAAGVGAYLGLRGPSPSLGGEVLHSAGDLPAAEDYLANPQQLIYDPATGFSEDAVKVLTLTSLQFSLERYLMDQGIYPASLEDLFPAYAVSDQNDQPLASPPDGFIYQQTGGGSGYEMSVALSGGKPYTAHQPTSTINPQTNGD